jgi:type IV pilus assembly protein PilM
MVMKEKMAGGLTLFKISNYFSKEEPFIAVDISSASLKALKLIYINGRWQVECFGRVALTEDLFDGFVVRNIPLLTQAIIELFASLSCSTKKVALALPDAAVISKVIQVSEGLDEYEIDELISIEFDKYIPFPLEEVNFDFQVLEASHKKQGLIDVLLVATRKENVESRVQAFEMANVDVQLIDVESSVIQRLLKFLFDADETLKTNPTPMTMVVDIGAYSIKQYVFERLKLVYVHEDEFGGRQLTDMAATHYGMTQEAFLTVIQNEQTPLDYHEEIFKPYLATVGTQVKRMVDYFFSTSAYSEINQLYLTGGVAALPGLVEVIHEQVKVETKLINPFQNMDFKVASDKEKFLKQASVWASLCGLAVRRYGHLGWLSL